MLCASFRALRALCPRFLSLLLFLCSPAWLTPRPRHSLRSWGRARALLSRSCFAAASYRPRTLRVLLLLRRCFFCCFYFLACVFLLVWPPLANSFLPLSALGPRFCAFSLCFTATRKRGFCSSFCATCFRSPVVTACTYWELLYSVLSFCVVRAQIFLSRHTWYLFLAPCFALWNKLVKSRSLRLLLSGSILVIHSAIPCHWGAMFATPYPDEANSPPARRHEVQQTIGLRQTSLAEVKLRYENAGSDGQVG